ncbi:MAG: L-lysine exporter family protein LysE/ArgO [Chlamydiales bacterium]|jgi:L-lysine exporter family protein LysE/ArgO
MTSAILTYNLLLGLSLAAPIGPVNLESIRRGLAGGFSACFTLWLGTALGNTLTLLVVYFSIGSYITIPLVKVLTWIIGGTMLGRMGYHSIRDSFNDSFLNKNSHDFKAKNAITVGFILALANPMAIVWWIGVFGGHMSSTGADESLMSHMIIIAGVILWAGFLASILSIGRQFITPKTMGWVSFFSGISLSYFAILYFYRASAVISRCDSFQELLG